MRGQRAESDHRRGTLSFQDAFSLSGRTAVVTGAAGGIGSAVARVFAGPEPALYVTGQVVRPNGGVYMA